MNKLLTEVYYLDSKRVLVPGILNRRKPVSSPRQVLAALRKQAQYLPSIDHRPPSPEGDPCPDCGDKCGTCHCESLFQQESARAPNHGEAE